MAILQIITFLIKAIVGAIASLLTAVFTHLVPALVAVFAAVALIFAVCTTCGIGSLAMRRKRSRERR